MLCVRSCQIAPTPGAGCGTSRRGARLCCVRLPAHPKELLVAAPRKHGRCVELRAYKDCTDAGAATICEKLADSSGPCQYCSISNSTPWSLQTLGKQVVPVHWSGPTPLNPFHSGMYPQALPYRSRARLLAAAQFFN
jgi:hypothetical protein